MVSGGQPSGQDNQPVLDGDQWPARGTRGSQDDGRSVWRSVYRLSGKPGELKHTSVHLMVSTGATALIGLGFWAAAAHLYSPSAVGRGSAEVAAMSLLAGFAQLNLANAFIRYLPGARTEAGHAVLFGYLLSLTTAMLVATAFVLSPLSDVVVPRGWSSESIFVLAVIFWTVFILQDGVLTGLSRAAVVPVENVGFGLAKLALLPVLVLVAPAHGVFLAWSLPAVVAVAGVSAYLIRRAIPRSSRAAVTSSPSSIPRGAELRSFLSAEYAHSLLTSAASFLLPILIVRQRGAVSEAHFYIPWLIYLSLNNLMANVSSGLVVEAAGKSSSPRVVRRAFAMMVAVAAVGMVLMVGVPMPLLRLLSPGYAVAGGGLLRLIGLSLPFGVVSTLFISYLWIERRIWTLVGARLLESVVLIGGVELLLGHFGISAAGIAVLVSGGLLTVIGGPLLVRWYRRLEDMPSQPAHGTAFGTVHHR